MIAHGWKVGGTRVTEAIDTSVCKILPIWEPYASRVVAGEKTWELRPDASAHVERVYIAVAARKRDRERAGSGAARLTPKGIRYLVGSVEVKGTRAVNEREFAEGQQDRHCFDEAASSTETRFEAARRMAGGRSGQLHAWEMGDAIWYEWPVPFKASPAVRWPEMATPGGATWRVERCATRSTGRRGLGDGETAASAMEAGSSDGGRSGGRRGGHRQRPAGTGAARAGTCGLQPGCAPRRRTEGSETAAGG